MPKQEYLGIMKNKLSMAAIALLVLFAACGGGSDSPDVKPSESKKKVVPAKDQADIEKDQPGNTFAYKISQLMYQKNRPFLQ
jgi:hypothetical protein